MMDLMIILFHLKLEKFYCAGVMIYLFVHIKMSYCWFNRQQLLQKAKDKYHNCSGKEKAVE